MSPYIDGSTDRRCFAIVTNERALLSRSDQPVRKLRQTLYCVFQAGKQTFKDRHICAMVYGALLISATDKNYTITKVKLTEIYRHAQLERDGAASLKSVVTASKTFCPRFNIQVVVMEAVPWILQLCLTI